MSGWGIGVVFPLYATHALIYFNIAIRARRAGWKGLYALGAMFGLYEGWVTRVLWFGYEVEQGPVLGTWLNVAWFEVFALVLFWHPVMAFVLPILTLSAMTGSGWREMPGPFGCLRKLLVGLGLLATAPFLAMALDYHLRFIFGAVLWHVLVVGILGFLFIRMEGRMADLVLSRRSLYLLIGATFIAFYGILWGIYDEVMSAPSLLGITVYALIWVFWIVVFLRIAPQENAPTWEERPAMHKIPILLWLLGYIAVLWLASALQDRMEPVTTVLYLSLPLFGLGFSLQLMRRVRGARMSPS